MSLDELNPLYERLSPEQRDELLRSLLIAAPAEVGRCSSC
jgi:hypothetical protein